MTSAFCRPLVAVLVAFACIMAPVQSQTLSQTYSPNDDVYLVIDSGVMANLQSAFQGFMASLQNTGVRVGALLYGDSVYSAFNFTPDLTQFTNLIDGLVQNAVTRGSTLQRNLTSAVQVMISQVSSNSQPGRNRKAVIITNSNVQYSEQLRILLYNAIVLNQIDVSAIFFNGNAAQVNNFQVVMNNLNVTVRTASSISDVTSRLQEVVLRQFSICSQCDVSGGVGYTIHTSACDRFIVCMMNNDGIIAYDQACAPGSLWDQNLLTCIHYENYETGCSYWCTNPLSTETYGTLDTTAFWNCSQGRPRYQSCGSNFLYDSTQRRCVPNPNPRTTNCNSQNYQAMADPCKFLQRDVANQQLEWLEQPCPAGARYNAQTCQCDIPALECSAPVVTQAPAARANFGGVCIADFCLNFDQDARTINPSNHKYEPWVDDTSDNSTNARLLTSNGYAQFGGRQSGNRLQIPFYSNSDFSTPVVFTLSFLEGSQDNQDQVLMTNGDCSAQPTVYIRYNPATRVLSLGVLPQSAANYVTTSVQLQDQWAAGQWKTVKMVYTGETLWGQVYSRANPLQRQDIQAVVAPLGGKIQKVQYPLTFGYQSTGNPFVGQMDDICVYTECEDPSTV